jgi:uncharacterized protein YjbI with pentapeptide repeats
MANQEHLDILRQGVEVWNKWREEHGDTHPDLSNADLNKVTLSGYDLSEADLSYAHLREADLSFSDFSFSDLSRANLTEAVIENAHLSMAILPGANLTETFLKGADLEGTNFMRANLTRANLTITNLIGANFEEADLEGTDFTGANLDSTHFTAANLTGANFERTVVGWATFGNVDLSIVNGLETVNHQGPSTIGIDTIIRSQGKIPEIFLQKAGVPSSIIAAILPLIGFLNPIDYYTCFISYSSIDQEFAERFHADLQNKGVRCWFAPEDMKIGDKIRVRIDESIRIYDKLLLVLSEHSVESNWVEFEVETALSKETKGKPTVLFPIRLDDTVMESSTAWAAHIKNTRHIGDFTKWKNHDDYQRAFTRLLRDLKSDSI